MKLSNLLAAAVVTGLVAGSVAQADHHEGDKAGGDKAAVEKNSCKGAKADDKNSCKGMKKKKKGDKNSCKNGCAGEKKEAPKAEAAPAEHK